ncbi:MAG: M28 family peptidase [Lewinellaceae bacterium]|nr:M28 family peptidase [Phaeodactylibacter sp.]MCB9039263.1 M28 family peptidase [Lewinellaceae bacterium]
MRHFCSLFFFLVGLLSLSAQNQLPTVTIQDISLDETAQSLLLTFDVEDAESDEVELFFLASDDSGQTFRLNTESASGDIGYPIAPGAGKQISWNYAGSIPQAGEYVLKVVADDRFPLDVQEMADQVDSNLLRERLSHIVGRRHYTVAPEKLDETRDTIEQAFLQYGLQTYRQNFPYIVYTGQNIIGTLPGATEDEAVIIVDGHYDTVAGSPGADDNGTAVVGVLEAARILSRYRFAKTLRFIGFDLEEVGLRGSRYYVENRNLEEDIQGVLNMEMIGYYTEAPNSQTLPPGFNLLFPDAYQAISGNEFRGDFLTNITVQSFAPLSNRFLAAAAQYVPELRIVSATAPDNLVPDDFTRSDHAYFWQDSIAALFLTDGAEFRNPNYHRSSDTLETINFTFMSRVVKAVIATAAELAGPQHSGEATATVQVAVGAEHLHQLDCFYTVSPNPAREELRLRFGQCREGWLAAELINLQGQRVLSRQVNPQEGNLVIATDRLPSGVYWLRLSNGEFFSGQKVVVE